MIFPTDAACDDSLKERLQNVPENRAGSSPLTYHTPLTPPCVPVGTRRFNYILRKETCMTRTAHGFRGMQVFSVLSRRTEKSSLNGRECLVLSNKLTSHSAPRRLELSAKKRAAADRVWRFLSAAARNLFFKQSELRLNRILYLGIEQVGVQL